MVEISWQECVTTSRPCGIGRAVSSPGTYGRAVLSFLLLDYELVAQQWEKPAQPEWDCLVVLPSVAEEEMGPDKCLIDERALEAIGGQDIPWLRRQLGERRGAQLLFSAWVDTLLDP